MECEKFEPLLYDELYDELDELTSAAVKRHVSGCSRCASMLNGMRGTRQLVSLPVLDPPPDLAERIIAAEHDAQKVTAFRSQCMRALSWAGSWAMRPQTAMAAVFLLMVGFGAVLLRANQHQSEHSAEVSVTIVGEPAATPSLAAPATVSAQASKGQEPFSSAMAAYRAGNFSEATRQFDLVAADAGDQNAAIWAARSVRDGRGCAAALGHYDAVTQKAGGSQIGNDALFESANCQIKLGQVDAARDKLNRLLGTPEYEPRARQALADLNAISARKAAASYEAAAPPPAAARAAASSAKPSAPAGATASPAGKAISR
jgi:hypothetical protein